MEHKHCGAGLSIRNGQLGLVLVTKFFSRKVDCLVKFGPFVWLSIKHHINDSLYLPGLKDLI